MINLLLPFQENREVANVLNQLNELKDLYADIGFTYTYQEPTTDEESKVTSINSESKVDMTNDQLQNIVKKVEDIRNAIIK